MSNKKGGLSHIFPAKERYYECPECKLKYREKKWAEACEKWCREHHTCNLDITAHADK